MDILFITPTNKLGLNQEVNGTMLLATKLLQADFSVDILRFAQIDNNRRDYRTFIDNITNRILEINPKCASFYTLWPYYHIMLRIAFELKTKNPEIIIVFGGPQSSATAYDTMKAMNCVDYISTGEGEGTIVPFFTSVLRNNLSDIETIPGLYYRKSDEVVFNHIEVPVTDLNVLPRWDERLFPVDYKKTEKNLTSKRYYMPIDAGRGCPYSCTFCCTSYFWKRTYRLKSAETILGDILYYNKNFGIKSFFFSHDAFTTNKALVAEVCDRIIAENLDINWKCTSRIDCIDKELILKMKRAGLDTIDLGVETGSAYMQKIINKNLNLEKAKEMIAFLLEQKITINLFFMYGFPEETEEDLNQTLNLAFNLIDSGVNYISMSYCKFNPTTAITEENFDNLVMDENIKAQNYSAFFGSREENQMIAENKAIFPFYYHLNTPVRNNYQYVKFLVEIYHKFPNSIRYLRNFYNGNDLQFYNDFYNHNKSAFEGDLLQAEAMVYKHPLEMLNNLIDGVQIPYSRPLKALLKFDNDVQRVSSSKTDMTLEETYNFSYVEHQMQIPIESFSDSKTKILLQKKDGKKNFKILSIN